MPLVDLPAETLLDIAEHLGPSRDLNSLVLTCRRFAHVLTPTLYRLALSTPGVNLLEWAIAQGNEDFVRLLLVHYRADINAGEKETPLQLAVFYQQEALLKLLLDMGADANSKDTNGRQGTALHMAARHGETGAIKALVSAGADVNARDRFGDTPLHYAVRSQNKAALVRQLLECGADANARSSHGCTPADDAAATGASLRWAAGCMAGWKPARDRASGAHLSAPMREQMHIVELLSQAQAAAC